MFMFRKCAYHVATLIQIQTITHNEKQKQVKCHNHILIVGSCWREFNKLLHSFVCHPETHVCNPHLAADQIVHFYDRCKIEPPIYRDIISMCMHIVTR